LNYFNIFKIIILKISFFHFVTSLCKAGGKQFKHWHSLDSTKELIKSLEQNEILKVGITTFKDRIPTL